MIDPKNLILNHLQTFYDDLKLPEYQILIKDLVPNSIHDANLSAQP